MRKLFVIVSCILIVTTIINICAGQKIKNYSHYPVEIIYLNYPENKALDYTCCNPVVDEKSVMYLKIKMPEREVLEQLGLPRFAYFENWYDLNLNWNKNFSWDKWTSGELWDRTSPKYSYQGGSVIIIYDEDRNIKELIYD